MQTIVSRQVSIYSRLLLIIVLIVLVFFLQACANHRRGAATPERAIEHYLDALETKDTDSILRLGLEDAHFAQEVKERIERVGGRKIKERKVVYTKPKSALWVAKISGAYAVNGGKKKFEDSLFLEYQSKGEIKLYAGRWYLSFDEPKANY